MSEFAMPIPFINFHFPLSKTCPVVAGWILYYIYDKKKYILSVKVILVGNVPDEGGLRYLIY